MIKTTNIQKMKALALSLLSLVSISTYAQGPGAAPPVGTNAYNSWKTANTVPGAPAPFSSNSINPPTGTAPGCYFGPDASYTTLPANDDGSTGLIALPFTFTLYGTNYTGCYVNNNGNITFTSAFSSFTSSGFPFATPMVAGFWADVDTRGAGSGIVNYKVEAHRLIVTYPGVGYFASHANLLNTFQIIITDGTVAGGLAAGENVAFYYGDMQWTEGDFSGGVNGFGANPATVGINHGNGIDYVQVGRFGLNNSNYDGGGGAQDGINFLDYECFTFNASGTVGSNNLPPSVSGAPSSNTITIPCGTTGTLNLSFLPPEVAQTVSTMINLGGLCNATINSNTSGSVSNTSVSITGAACNVGTHHIIYTATDDAAIPASTIVDITVIVTPCANVPTMSEWGLLILSLISLTIGMIFIYRRENAFAFAGGDMKSSGKMNLLDKSLLSKLFAIMLGLAVAGLSIAYVVAGSITATDTIGSVITAAIAAYMVHLFILFRRNDNN